MTLFLGGPLCTVSPLEAPSWLTAEPRRSASTGWLFARASERRSSSSRPTPSEKPAPSAPAPKDLQRPSGARPRWRDTADEQSGRRKHRHPSGQRQRALPRPQGLAREMDRHERGGAGGVEVDRGPLQTEGVGDAPRDHARRAAGQSQVLELGQVDAETVVREGRPRRRPPSGCPSATRDRSPHPRRPPTRIPAAVAAGGPSPALRAGSIPKKAASNPPTSSRNPPCARITLAGRSGRDRTDPPDPSRDRLGNGPIASSPAASSSHSSSGVETPPG